MAADPRPFWHVDTDEQHHPPDGLRRPECSVGGLRVSASEGPRTFLRTAELQVMDLRVSYSAGEINLLHVFDFIAAQLVYTRCTH